MAGRRPAQQDDPAASAAADPLEGGQDGGGSSEQRLTAIEQTQARQGQTLEQHGGLLQRILDKLPGGGSQDGPPAAGAGGTPPTPAAQQATDLRGMVAEEIAAAEQRRADEQWAENDDKWRSAVDEFMEKIKGEQVPRDPAPGVRGVLQRLTLGKPE